MTAGAIASLATAQMPRLLSLYLDENQLDSAAMEQLVRGSWPCMFILELQHNLLNDVSMLHLAKGNWPRLCRLRLNDNRISFVGVRLLTAGIWPLLCSLSLDECIVSKETWAILSLQHHQENWRSERNIVDVARCAAPGAHLVLWPNLYNVSIHQQILSQTDQKVPRRLLGILPAKNVRYWSW